MYGFKDMFDFELIMVKIIMRVSAAGMLYAFRYSLQFIIVFAIIFEYFAATSLSSYAPQ